MIALSRFRQTLVGSYRLGGDDRERPLSLEIAQSQASLLPKLGGGLAVEGQIDAKGLADRRAVRGRVLLDRWMPLRSRYELELEANDGAKLTLSGERRPEARTPFWSASTVGGEIRDSNGAVVARFELRIDYRQGLSRWLGR